MHLTFCNFQLAGCDALLAGVRVDLLLRLTEGAGGAVQLGETGLHHGLMGGV